MIDFSRLTSLPFWITRNPNAISSEFLQGWLVVTTIILVVGIGIRIWASRNSDLATQWVSWYYRISRLMVTISITSYFLIFFRYERVPLFAARWWVLVLLIWAIIWLVSILKQRHVIKQAVEKRQLVQRLARFLPKRKK